MERSLEDVLAELDAAEKEYAKKCKEYGIEETSSKKNDSSDSK